VDDVGEGGTNLGPGGVIWKLAETVLVTMPRGENMLSDGASRRVGTSGGGGKARAEEKRRPITYKKEIRPVNLFKLEGSPGICPSVTQTRPTSERGIKGPKNLAVSSVKTGSKKEGK